MTATNVTAADLRKILARVAAAALKYPQFRSDLMLVRARVKEMLAMGRWTVQDLTLLHIRLGDMSHRMTMSFTEDPHEKPEPEPGLDDRPDD